MIRTPVLINGGDACGATLAVLLSQKGVKTIVIVEGKEGLIAPGAAADALAQDPDIDLRLGWRLFGFERFEDRVTAHIMTEDGEGQQQVQAQYLVACDGLDSRVRHFLDIDLQGLEGRQVAKTFGRGRAILAGAAAHPVAASSPGSLEVDLADAYCLADLIAAGLADPSKADIQAAFEAARRPAALG